MYGTGKLWWWLVCVLGAVWLAPGEATASSRSAAVVRTDTPPEIDGVLDDPAWQDAVLLDPLIQVNPVEGAEPSERTEIRILYDSDYLYLGIRMYDSEPDKLVATQMVQDQDMTADDRINLTLDTFHDQRNAYFFQVNPLGTRSEGLIENNSNFRRDWDGIWYAKATVDDQGWSAEFAIPFQTVAFAVGDGVWGFEAERQIRRKNEYARWANPSRNRTVLNVAGIGTLTGLSDLDGTSIDVKPSGSLSYAKARDDDRASGFAFDPDHVAKASLDVVYKFHPSVTAGLTLNTDFMEAPVDEFRTDLTRFPPFFPELRDFFLQDAGIFEFGGLVGNGLPFHSRRVGRLGASPKNEILDIDGGLKITGRLGDTSFGGLSVRVPEQSDMDKTAYLTVVRVQQNILEGSAIGLIGTQGDPLGNVRTGLVGADFQYFNAHVRGSNIVSGNAFFMYNFSEEDDSSQEAFGASLEYPNDRYNGGIEFKQLGDNFKPALGFVNRRGIRQYDAWAHYRVRPNRYLRSITTAAGALGVTNLHNDLETLVVTVDALDLENNAGDRLTFTYEYHQERLLSPDSELDPGVEIIPGSGFMIPLGTYRFSRYGVRLETTNARPVRTIAEVIFGTFYNGTLRQVNATLELRPLRYVFVSFEYEQNDQSMGWCWQDGVEWQDGCEFTQRLGRARLNLSLTPEISWTNVVQYETVADRIGLNSILRWEIDPGNDVYLIFNQNWDQGNSGFYSMHTLFAAKVAWTFRF
jgi:hypothetical protein